jgi:hypothetical protein
MDPEQVWLLRGPNWICTAAATQASAGADTTVGTISHAAGHDNHAGKDWVAHPPEHTAGDQRRLLAFIDPDAPREPIPRGAATTIARPPSTRATASETAESASDPAGVRR